MVMFPLDPGRSVARVVVQTLYGQRFLTCSAKTLVTREIGQIVLKFNLINVTIKNTKPEA